ncbi:MAG: hypothetical protein ACO30M_02620 [Candidatus Kapaibacteriota bacterium]
MKFSQIALLIVLFQLNVCAQTVNLMYYVSARPGEHGMWVSRQKADGSWIRGEKVLIDGVFDGNGVDPDIFKQDDGSLRLYYFQGYFVTPPPQNPGPNPIYSAVSTDGVRFTGKRKVFEYNNIFDPSVVRLPNGNYVMGLTNMIGNTVNTVIATSADGLSFTYKTTVENTGIPELMVLQDGSIRLYYNGPGGIVSSRSTDGGTTWQKEQGTRLAFQQFVGDPSISKVGDRLRMYVKGFNANGGQKLVGHKTQYAESTDGGNTFQMQQQLVLDSASVPEGVEVQAKLTLNTVSKNDTLCIGEDTRFEVSGGIQPSSLGLRYEWQKNGIKISNGGRITGATTSTLNITKTELSDSGSYSVNIFVDDLSTGSLQQNVGPIRLILNPATTLLKEPDSLYVICHDEEVTLSCDAMGSNVTYQWYDIDAKPLPGQNKKELIVRKTTSDKHSYYCMMKGDCGLITSRIARVKFIPKLVIEKDLSQIYELEVGNDTTLSVLTNCTECTSQWYKNGKASKPEEQVVNGKTSIVIKDMDSTKTGTYRVIVRNGCDTIESQACTLVLKQVSSVDEVHSLLMVPQPAESYIYMQINDAHNQECRLVNLHGIEMLSWKLIDGNAQIDISHIPSGIYYVQTLNTLYPCIILH